MSGKSEQSSWFSHSLQTYYKLPARGCLTNSTLLDKITHSENIVPPLLGLQVTSFEEWVNEPRKIGIASARDRLHKGTLGDGPRILRYGAINSGGRSDEEPWYSINRIF